MKNKNYNKAVERVNEYHDDKKDKILYEWNVDPAKWKKSMKPIEDELNKAFKSEILLFTILGFGMTFLLMMLLYIAEEELILSMLSVPLILLAIFIPMGYFGTKSNIKSLYNHEKYVYFMTNEGIYNGWTYSKSIFRYRIPEKEQKISLYLRQTIHQGHAGKGYRSAIIWNDFYYNEKDKPFIFQILAQWEKEATDVLIDLMDAERSELVEGRTKFRAASSNDERHLHKY